MRLKRGVQGGGKVRDPCVGREGWLGRAQGGGEGQTTHNAASCISMLKCPSASRCQCREGRLHLDARCEQMQGAGLHLASRCEKMQAPEQFQATDALEKSPEAPQNCIFGCTKVLYATIRHIWCFKRHIWFRSRSIPPVLSPFLTTFPTCPGKDANNAGI